MGEEIAKTMHCAVLLFIHQFKCVAMPVYLCYFSLYAIRKFFNTEGTFRGLFQFSFDSVAKICVTIKNMPCKSKHFEKIEVLPNAFSILQVNSSASPDFIMTFSNPARFMLGLLKKETKLGPSVFYGHER